MQREDGALVCCYGEDREGGVGGAGKRAKQVTEEPGALEKLDLAL